jgi:hypothetical protein
MLADIVLDTNVLVHADNLQEPRRQDCCELIAEMTNCTTHLCLDEGFDLNEANNKSIIGSEYAKHLRFGMVGFALVSHLARSMRLKQLSHRVPQNVARQIMTQVPKGPDRIFLKIAFNSNAKTLACHDFNDVPATVRARLRQSIGLHVLDASAAVAALR